MRTLDASDATPCVSVVPRSRAAYVGELARRPPALVVSAAAVIACAASGTLIGLPVICAVAVVTLTAASRPGVQQRLDDERTRRARRERREARETALEEAGVRGRRLAVLTELADTVTERDPPKAPELEGMLDRYAAAAIALERCNQVLDAATVLSHAAPLCRDRGGALREELALIEEHVLLLAEQSALATCDALARQLVREEP